MALRIEVQLLRDDKVIDKAIVPVYPGAEYHRWFGPLGLEPMVDGNLYLRGFKVTLEAEFIDKLSEAMK